MRRGLGADYILSFDFDDGCTLYILISYAHYCMYVAAAAKSLQSCPTLCDPIDSSPPGSPVPGIFQARTLEWGVIAISSAWKCKVKVKSLSRVRLSATPWTAAYQAPPSMGFSRQEYWSGVPLPYPACMLKFYKNVKNTRLFSNALVKENRVNKCIYKVLSKIPGTYLQYLLSFFSPQLSSPRDFKLLLLFDSKELSIK